jgi:hypothetical protein
MELIAPFFIDDSLTLSALHPEEFHSYEFDSP